MSFIANNTYSLPPLLDLVNDRLQEREPSTPDSSPRVTPPWENDPNWEYNEAKEWAERERKELSQFVTKCEADIARLVKSSAPNAPDQSIQILGHFEEASQGDVIEILNNFETVRDWFRAESLEEPATVTFTRTPRERQALAELMAGDAAIKKLIGDSVPDLVDLEPLEEGEYKKEQKEYWEVRKRWYSEKRHQLQKGQKELWILYRRSRSRKRARNAETTALSQARPTKSQRTGRFHMTDQSQLRNVGESDKGEEHQITRRRTKEHRRGKHSINGTSVDEPSITGTASPPAKWLYASSHNDFAEPKQGKHARKPRNPSTSEASMPLRRSTRISKKPERFLATQTPQVSLRVRHIREQGRDEPDKFKRAYPAYLRKNELDRQEKHQNTQRSTKEDYRRHKHSIDGAEPHNDLAEPKRGKRVRKPRNKSTFVPSGPLRRSTRITKKPEKFPT